MVAVAARIGLFARGILRAHGDTPLPAVGPQLKHSNLLPASASVVATCIAIGHPSAFTAVFLLPSLMFNVAFGTRTEPHREGLQPICRALAAYSVVVIFAHYVANTPLLVEWATSTSGIPGALSLVPHDGLDTLLIWSGFFLLYFVLCRLYLPDFTQTDSKRRTMRFANITPLNYKKKDEDGRLVKVKRYLTRTVHAYFVRYKKLLQWAYVHSAQLLVFCFFYMCLAYPCFLSFTWVVALILGVLLPVHTYNKTMGVFVVFSVLYVAVLFVFNIPGVANPMLKSEAEVKVFGAIGLEVVSDPFSFMLPHCITAFLVAVSVRLSRKASMKRKQENQSPRSSASEEGRNWIYGALATLTQYILFNHTLKISLAVLFLAGLMDVSVIHSGLVLFFVICIASSRAARKLWPLLVAYLCLILMAKYAFHVLYSKLASVPHEDGLRIIGLRVYENPWELSLYIVLLLAAVAQLRVYNNMNYATHQTRHLMRPLLATHLRRLLALFLTYMALLLMGLLYAASLTGGIFLAFFLVVMAVQCYTDWTVWLPRIWLALLALSGTLAFVMYLTQFKSIHDTLVLDWLPSANLRAEDFPITLYDGAVARIKGLLPIVLTVAVNVATVRWFREYEQAKLVAAHSSGTFEMQDLTKAPPRDWLALFNRYVVSPFQRVAVVHTPKVLIAIMFFTTFTSPASFLSDDGSTVGLGGNILVCIYAFVALLLLLRSDFAPGPVVVGSIGSFSVLAIIVSYFYQFPFATSVLDRWVSRADQAYIGLHEASDHAQGVIAAVVPHLLIFVVCSFQNTVLQWRTQLYADALHPYFFKQKKQVLPGIHKPSPIVHQELVPQRWGGRELCKWFLSVFEAFLDHFFERHGFEANILAFIMAFALTTHRVWCLMYIGLIALAMQLWREGMARKGIWTAVNCLLCCVLAFQYSCYLSVLPSWRKDWYAFLDDWVPSAYIRYFGIHPGPEELVLTFLVLFICALQRRVFQFERQAFPREMPAKRLSEILTPQLRAQINEARASLDPNALRELLPIPHGAVDYTTSPRLLDKLTYMRFTVTPHLILFFTFLNGAMGRRLTIIKVGKLLITLLFFHRSEELQWRGNQLWRFLFVYFVVISFLQALFGEPHLREISANYKIFFFLGLSPSDDPPVIWKQFVVQNILFFFIYLQRKAYDDPAFAFALHHARRQMLKASEKGAQINRVYLARLKNHKEKEMRERSARSAALDRLREARQTGNDYHEALQSALETIVNSERAHESEESGYKKRGVLSVVHPAIDRVTKFFHVNSLAGGEFRRTSQEDRWAFFLASFSRWARSYTDWLCYWAFVVNFLYSPNPFSMILPASAFIYAALMTPRPHKLYWSVVITYTEFLILAKSAMQFVSTQDLETQSSKKTIFGRVSLDFISDVGTDLVVLIVVIWHRHLLTIWGVWHDNTIERPARKRVQQAVKRKLHGLLHYVMNVLPVAAVGVEPIEADDDDSNESGTFTGSRWERVRYHMKRGTLWTVAEKGIAKEGWLWKHGSNFSSKWHRKYFVLRGADLHYFDSRPEGDDLDHEKFGGGLIDVRGASIEGKPPPSFKIAIGGIGKREIELGTGSEAEKTDWVSHLTSAKQRYWMQRIGGRFGKTPLSLLMKKAGDLQAIAAPPEIATLVTPRNTNRRESTFLIAPEPVRQRQESRESSGQTESAPGTRRKARVSFREAEVVTPTTTASSTFPVSTVEEEMPEPEGPSQILMGFFRTYFYNIAGTAFKKGGDFYTLLFIVDFTAFVWLLFSYYSIIGNQATDFVSSLTNNLLPGSLVLIQMSMFLIMVLDRIAYLQRAILLKITMHFILVILYHLIFFIWYWQNIVNEDPTQTATQATADQSVADAATATQTTSTGSRIFTVGFLFFLKALYLALSSLQIRHGFAAYKRPNFFAKRYSAVFNVIYLVYRAIPFVVELKALLDWSFTRTTLKIYYWLKLEDITHELYLLRCDMEDTKVIDRKPSQPFPVLVKMYTGFVGFVILLFIIFFPLLIYSTYSPALTLNAVSAVSVQIQFANTAPMFSDGQEVTVSSTQIKDTLDSSLVTLANELDWLYPSLDAFSLASTDWRVQLVSMKPISASIWAITPPARKELMTTLNQTDGNVEIVMTMQLSRIMGQTKELTFTHRYVLPASARRAFLQRLDGTSQQSITLPNFYSPFLLNKQQLISNVTSVKDPVTLRKTCIMDIERDNITFVDYCRLQCTALFQLGNTRLSSKEKDCVKGTAASNTLRSAQKCPSYDSSTSDFTNTPLYFVTLSEKVPGDTGIGSFIQSFGIIALYTTFVLTISRVLKLATAGMATKVVVEDMVDPAPVLALVEAIYMARAEHDLQMEEELYEQLILLYRSPEEMLRITTTVAVPPGSPSKKSE
eukprot:TRINITY_DN4176_c0_g1_i3.p1 TRINITY_DN4176_c0_g1~~TRINITY_DN4176_c0_g1_i3.p1  ORF type:complete len:2539 (+),score=363.67 TRINITY_DN4176_c0_g1_i3:493-7617(+)